MTSRFYDDKSTVESDSLSIEDYLNSPEYPLEIAIEPIIDILPNVMNYVETAKEICSNPSDGLTSDESASIYLYTIEDVGIYKKLNDIIENKQSYTLLEPWIFYLKLFYAALSNLPSLKTQIWRGINRNITIDNPGIFVKNKTFTWWRITSCTTNVRIVQNFMQEQKENTLIMINCKNGKSIREHSSYPDEQEIILLPGTHLKVVGDPFELNGLHVIHLDEIERDEEDKSCSSKNTNPSFMRSNSLATSLPDLSNITDDSFVSPRLKLSVSSILSPSSTSTTKFSNGDTYDGQMCLGVKTGHGRYVWASGDAYIGQWEEDKFQGEGLHIWISGNEYSGQWVAGKRQGRGKFSMENGNIYDGNWFDNKRHGIGTFISGSGDEYEGEWQDDKRTGKGVWKSKDNHQYSGDFIDGERHGTGCYTWPDGATYDGQWQHGSMHGKGTRTYANGNVYIGDWMNDKRHGVGTFIWASGDTYEGQYENDLRHGEGTYVWSNENKFIGNWIDDERTGTGTFVWADGTKYIGDFVAGERNGVGFQTWPSGDTYEGEYANNELSGWGKYTWASGKTHEGLWEKGKQC